MSTQPCKRISEGECGRQSNQHRRGTAGNEKIRLAEETAYVLRRRERGGRLAGGGAVLDGLGGSGRVSADGRIGDNQ